jgi:hypothetical protein
MSVAVVPWSLVAAAFAGWAQAHPGGGARPVGAVTSPPLPPEAPRPIQQEGDNPRSIDERASL